MVLSVWFIRGCHLIAFAVYFAAAIAGIGKMNGDYDADDEEESHNRPLLGPNPSSHGRSQNDWLVY